MSEGESKTIIGRCEEISEKNGWTSFHIDVGSQYPVRLSTKVPALIEKGRSVGEAVSTWHFKESQGKENPNRPGTYYQNRYLEGVEPAGSPMSVGNKPTAGGSESAHRPVSQGDKDRSITRMAVLKAASDLYAGTGDVDAVFAAASRMETWVYRDIDPVPFIDEGESVQGAAAGPVDPNADIPFAWLP